MAAYLIANYDVTNEADYQSYMAAVVPTIAGHDGEILVAGSEGEPIEGNPGAITVVLRFPSMNRLRGWYDSPEYRKIISLRTSSTEGGLVFANEFAMPNLP